MSINEEFSVCLKHLKLTLATNFHIGRIFISDQETLFKKKKKKATNNNVVTLTDKFPLMLKYLLFALVYFLKQFINTQDQIITVC